MYKYIKVKYDTDEADCYWIADQFKALVYIPICPHIHATHMHIDIRIYVYARTHTGEV